jgi:hypothetical protein
LLERHSNEFDLDPSAPRRSPNNVHRKTLGFPVFEFSERGKDLRIRNAHWLGYSLPSVPKAKQHAKKESPDQMGDGADAHHLNRSPA